ncbi:hypothetical protein BDW74DRAFT_177353 [Aspergillus multicolor]|uniref:alpha/beta hydrolase n=1 Tax=Aspergillus multicolor TaxID=41759 RepID=UPI003CCD60A2
MTSENPDSFAKLMLALSALKVDKYGAFEVLNTSYKSLGSSGVGIDTDILIHRSLLTTENISRCPVIVRIHGGFLVTGSSLYPPWFSNWILDYAIQNGAIIISPNYRLLPEATGMDILSDMDDLWSWLHSETPRRVIEDAGYANIHLAIDKIILAGESAGGYLAMQLALSYPSQIRAVIAAYPTLDLNSPFYTESYPKPIIGVPNIPVATIEAHLAAVRESQRPQIVTAADPPERLKLAFSIFQNGRVLDFLGQEPDLFPLQRVEKLAEEGSLDLPPLFLFHGEQDSAVQCEGTRRFADLLLRCGIKGEDVRVYIQDGDHGFDSDATLETGWLKEGLAMISRAWLGVDTDSGTPH